MKWSLLAGRFWGTEIRLHISLLLLIPYVLLSFGVGGFREALYILLLFSAIFACVALHEMGHTLAARFFGIEVKSIVLWPLGGLANLSRRPESILQDMIISIADPLSNLILFGLLAVVTLMERMVERLEFFPRLAYLLSVNDVFPFLAGLTMANLALALFNLAPVYPLDGGQIARGLLKLLFGDRRADLILIVFSLPPALGLTLLGLVTRDVIIVLTGLLMVLAALTLNLRLTNALTLAGLYLFDRARYHVKRMDFDPAVQEYTRAIQKKPDRADLYLSRAVAQIGLAACEEAKTDVQQAIALDANNATAWVLLGELFALEKQHGQAMAAYNRAVEIKPNWAVAYLDRGELYQDLGQMQWAQGDIERAVELGQSAPVTYLLRSKLRYRLGDRTGARADAEQALGYAPQWMLVFNEMFLNNFQGHLAWALAYYQMAIQRMPNAYQAYQGRADTCRVNHRPDWALVDYNHAVQLAPGQAELYLSRGQTYLLLGKVEPAAADFRQAVQLADRSHIRRQAASLYNRVIGQNHY